MKLPAWTQQLDGLVRRTLGSLQGAASRAWKNDVGAGLQVDLDFALAVLNKVLKVHDVDSLCSSPQDGDTYVQVRPSAEHALHTLVFLVQPYEDLCSLLQIHRVVPLGYDYLDVRVFDILHSDELSLDADLVPVFDATDV